MSRLAKNKLNPILIICLLVFFFNLIHSIQLDTTQWQEVDITNDFINQSFIQYSGFSRYQDSLQLSQKKYANLIRSFSDPGETLIQVLDEYGNQLCNKAVSVEYYGKNSLTKTNIEGEFFLAYASKVSGIYKVFFGFLDEACYFKRGLSQPVQIDDFKSISFLNVLAKNGKENVYVVSQRDNSFPYNLYLMIVDISNKSTYSVKKYVKLGSANYRWNLFSIQAFSDDYSFIFVRDNNDKLQKITIKPNDSAVWDEPKNQGIFLNLNQNSNRIQNKAIQIENTNKYSIVTGDRYQDILTIYTFQYNGNGEIQDTCLETYSNQFGNVANYFFEALEFGVINQDFLWIKGDNNNDSYKTVIFFANPLDCQVYRNQDDSSIYQYQLEHFGYSHIFHTYYSNQTVSLIASSSYIDGNNKQILQAIRISIKDCHDDCRTCYGYDTCLSCYGDMGLNKQNKCQCLQNSIQAYGYKGQCKVCQNFKFNQTFEGYWSNGDCFENYYLPDIIKYIINNCKIKLNSDYFYCRDQSDLKKITNLQKDGEFISCNQIAPLVIKRMYSFN